MTLLEATKARHTVRHFDGKPLTEEHKNDLLKFINEINTKSKLNFQLVVNEPKAFGGQGAARSNFTGCVNYLALIGKLSTSLKEDVGYYGEQVVLHAQQLGINSCWVVLTYDKVPEAYKIQEGEDIVGVIALGYGTTQGKSHQSKPINEVMAVQENLPQWYLNGVTIALNAPTGINKQGFKFELVGENTVKATNVSFCQEMDLGIVKYHFELGANNPNLKWEK